MEDTSSPIKIFQSSDQNPLGFKKYLMTRACEASQEIPNEARRDSRGKPEGALSADPIDFLNGGAKWDLKIPCGGQ